MGTSSKDLENAHNQGQTDESEGRSDCYQGLQKVGYSEEERDAYNKGVENAQEQKDSK